MKTDSQRVADYVRKVRSGKLPACKWVRLACDRYIRDKKERNWLFSAEKAQKVADFCRKCVHTDGEWAGQPYEPSDFQLFIIWNLFGFLNRFTKKRRFTKAFITMARKNGKTFFAACLALYGALEDDEPGARVYAAATTKEQAGLLLDQARSIALRSFPDRCAVYYNYIQSAEDDRTQIRTVAGDGRNIDGLNPSMVIKDELHEWRSEKHRDLHQKLSTAGASRSQPLELMITTAGDERSPIWEEEDEYAQSILETGVGTEQRGTDVFVYIARLDEGVDVLSAPHWPHANPNLGVSVSEAYLARQAQEARDKPAALNAFARYHANVKVTSSERAIDKKLWDRATAPEWACDLGPGFGAFDLGRSDDFSAWAICIPQKIEDVWHYWVRSQSYTCKMHPETPYEMLYKGWQKRGELICHPGESVDYGLIEDDIVEAGEQFGAHRWAYDSKFATVMAQRLLNHRGVDCGVFPQNHATYNEPFRMFGKLLKTGRIHHLGNDCEAWQIGNLTVQNNGRDEWMPDKGGRKTMKVDAPVAILMAFALALLEVQQESFYVSNSVEWA